MRTVDREELQRHWVPAGDKRLRVVRRLGLALGAVLVLAGLSVPTGAVPMARIVGFQVRVYNYADHRYTNCHGSALEKKVRLQPLVFGSARPSEHFTVKLQIDKRYRRSGNFHWRLEEQYIWDYQHIPADAASLRFQAAYSEQGSHPVCSILGSTASARRCGVRRAGPRSSERVGSGSGPRPAKRRLSTTGDQAG